MINEKVMLEYLSALKTIRQKGAEKEFVTNLIAQVEGMIPESSKLQSADNSEILVFVDGGSRGNPGPSACACIIKIGNSTIKANRFLGNGTNNEAEYSAVILAIEKLKEIGICNRKVKFFSDSQLTMKQLSGEWRIKEPRLQSFTQQIYNILEEMKLQAEFNYIPREQNSEADKLTNQALDGLTISLLIP